MPAWEYMTWAIYDDGSGQESVRLIDGKPHSGEDGLSAALSLAGAESWELVGMHAIREGWARYVFMRPKRGA